MVKTSEQTEDPSIPTVFVSYTHETPEHKRWVARLTTDLRTNGVDAALDQWDVRYGQDLTLFMERGIRESDRVLLICTPSYARKANEGEGGVGYERLVVTAELAEKIDTTKFVCVLRCGSKEDSIPTFAKTRLFVDFREDTAYDVRLEELLRDIFKAPADPKPTIGANPFKQSDKAQVSVVSAGAKRSELESSVDVEETYAKAEELLRNKDLLGWKRLVRNTRRHLGPRLIEWREVVEHSSVTNETWPQKINEALTIGAPLFVLALSAVESEIDTLRDQRGIIDDFVSLDGWNRNGSTVVVAIPNGLAYVYHHVLGAFLVDCGHHKDAINLLVTNVSERDVHTAGPLWMQYHLMGWPQSWGENRTTAWEFLTKLPDHQPWIRHFFTRDASFLRALESYVLLASLVELANAAKQDTSAMELAGYGDLHVPPLFVSGDAFLSVLSMAVPDRAILNLIAGTHDTDAARLKELWPTWLQVWRSWLTSARLLSLAIRVHGNPPDLP